MKRTLYVCFVVAASTSLASAASPAATAPPDFGREVAPVLRKYCTSCHSTDEPEKGLVLETHAAVLKGGEKGAVVVPGKSDLSRLVLVLDGRAKPAMPPKDNEAPTPAEIDVLKRWIDAGAKPPAVATPDVPELKIPSIKPRVAVRSSITAAAVSPDGALVALAGYHEVRLISRSNRSLVRTLVGPAGNVTAISFSTDGALLVAAGGEPGMVGELRIWQTATGTLVRTFTGHKDSLYAAALSRDGKLLATGSYDQKIKLWDAGSGQELRMLEGHSGAIFDLAFHPGGKVLASASADRTVKLWDVAKGVRLDTLSQPTKEVLAVAFSPDGKTLVSGAADNRLRVYRVSATAAENTNPLVITRFAHEGAVLKLAYSADGKTLATSGEDRIIRLWNTADYIERLSLGKQPDLAPALAFAPDGLALVVGRLDGSLTFFDPAKGMPIAPAKPELASVWPRGIARGTTTRVLLKGNNLLGATKLEFVGAKPDDFRVKLEPVAANQAMLLHAEITPSAMLARRDYEFKLTTPGGMTMPLMLYIDDLPQAPELTAKGMSDRVQEVKLPMTSWGKIEIRGDRDLLRFDAKHGETLVFEVAAKRIGSTLNALLTLLDPAGEVISSNNDFDGQNDPLIAYTIPADGRYTIRIQDQSLTGSDTHFYRLSAGALPFVTGVFPPSVPVGQATKLELAGYNLPKDAPVNVEPKMAGEMVVPLDASRFRSRAPFKVLATADQEQIEREPNDQPQEATPIKTPAAVGGRLVTKSGGGGDVDLFAFESSGGQSWVIETSAAGRGSPADTKVEVLDAQGKPVERVVLQAVRDSSVTFRPINSRDIDVRVLNWEEMELNQYMYMAGEVCKIFRMPQGPDSGFQFYAMRNQRRPYFDTSATTHALDDPAYIVEPHRPGEKLIGNGLPVFRLRYENDDDADRELGTDSRLMFTAPTTGRYLVRVSESQGFGGDRFAYRLVVRKPEPGFVVTLKNREPTVNAESAVGLNFGVQRIDDFDDDIVIEATGLPAGYRFWGPVTIEAGHNDARAVLSAEPDAKPATAEAWKKVHFTAHAKINGATVTRDIAGLDNVKLAPRPELIVHLEPAEVTIAPGERVRAKLRVERRGYEDRIPFDVLNLPHGLIVDNIGLNGILIPEKQNERDIFINAAGWVGETDRYAFAETKNFRGAKAGNQASIPLLVHVRAPKTIAAGSPVPGVAAPAP